MTDIRSPMGMNLHIELDKERDGVSIFRVTGNNGDVSFRGRLFLDMNQTQTLLPRSNSGAVNVLGLVYTVCACGAKGSLIEDGPPRWICWKCGLEHPLKS